MGEVITTFKVMPDGLDIDLNGLKTTIKKDVGAIVEVHDIGEQPIAFGLKALLVMVTIPEQEGILEKVETALGAIEGVSQVDTVDARRAL
jgi:elongation factor 1-beta